MTTKTDKEREAFEDWAKSAGYSVARKASGITYADSRTNDLLQCWQARAKHGKGEFNEGDRVVWTNNYGTEFPATVHAKGTGYHIVLDDGSEITTSGKLRALIAKSGE